jgi:hypothetical protein
MKTKGIQLTDSADSGILMDLKIKVVRNAENKITQGLVVGNTMNQNQALILIANPGEFKFMPTLGVAIDELILDDDYLRFRHRIREHFAKDGLKVKSVQLSEGKPLLIDASYE